MSEGKAGTGLRVGIVEKKLENLEMWRVEIFCGLGNWAAPEPRYYGRKGESCRL